MKRTDAAGGSVANLVRDVTSNSYPIDFVAAFMALSTFSAGVSFNHCQATHPLVPLLPARRTTAQVVELKAEVVEL